jgi:surface protein
MISASKTLKKNLSIAVATVFLAVAAFACWAIEPSKAYADTTDSHLTVASEVHVLVDSEGNVTIPNATVTNDGTCAAYIMGCSSPDGLGWTCDAVGKRIEVGQSITATWRSAGPVSDEIAAQLGEEPYYAGNLTYTYTDGDLKGTVSLDNTDPTVGDTITATVTGANVPDDKLTYQWVKVKDGSETSIDGATGSTYTATDDDAGYELVCKVSSTDDVCQGTICGATGAVKKIQAFAVYSADDGSLSFYKRAEVPKQGTMYLGKRATAVYTGLENMTSIPGWMLNYSKDIKTAIVYDEGISPIGTGHWFAELRNMKTAEVSKLDMSKCQTISCMFSDCTSLTSLDLSTWNTRSLTDMNQAFQNCTSLTKLNVSGWDVSKVTNMTLAFAEDRALSSLDLSTWDNSAVTSMKDVFSMMDSLNEVSLGSKFKFVGTSPFLPDQTGHVAGADGKWYDTDGNGYAPADIPSNKAMTYYASKDLVPGITISGNAEVGETLTATVNNLSEEEITGYQWYTVDDSSNETAIANATAHTYTVTANEVGKKILCKAFYKNGSATKNVKTTPTDNVTPQKTAFAVYSADDNSLDFYKRTEVPTAGSTFEGKTATAVYTGIETYTYTRNLPWNGYASKIKTATVVDDGLQPKSTASWFTNCKSITQCDMSKLDTSTLADASGMFYNCSSLTTIGDLSSWDVSNLANASHMFDGCSKLTTIGDLSGWDVSNLANATEMFGGCSKLTTIGDLSSWDVSNLTNAINMFCNCSSLTTIGDLSSWDVSNLANASHMFDGCSKLTTIGDLSSWNISKMTNASSMFSRCSSLTTIGDLSGWDVSNLASSQWMFFNCSRLSVNCSSWDVSKVTNHSNFNTNAPGVILPLAWQTSSDEGDENSAIAPLCEEQGNGDALSVPSENDNNDADEAASKTDGKASADSETEGSNTASATDEAGAKEEEAPGDVAQEVPIAA